MNRHRVYWVCQLAGWSVFFAINLIIVTLFQKFDWERTFLIALTCVLGLVATHLYRAFVRRRGWLTLSLSQLIPRVLLSTLVLATFIHAITDPVGRFVLELDTYEKINSEVGYLILSLFNGSAIMLLWSLIYFGLHYLWNYRQAEVDKWKLKAQVESTKLRALKLQLNPHFLFNSLNSVRALIVEDPDRAQTMVTRLAGLLRTTLRSDHTTTVPLQEEMRTVRAYLELESVRLEERLQTEIDVDPATFDHPVPFMLVQTLVENGIKHGIAARPKGGQITITARFADDGLKIRVTNTGHLDAAARPEGVGLQNARERLHLLFGGEASLRLFNADADTVAAEVTIPPVPLDSALSSEPAAAPSEAEPLSSVPNPTPS